MTLRQQMCQGAHAAHEAGIHFGDKTAPISFIVICSVQSEDELLRAQYDIQKRGIKTVLFTEPDIDNQATALATEPIPKTKRNGLSKYQLWTGE